MHRKLLHDLSLNATFDVGPHVVNFLARLAELVEALNGWLRRGGAFPEAWSAQRGIDMVALELHSALEQVRSLTELEALHDACENYPAGSVRHGLLKHYAWRLGLLDPKTAYATKG